MFSRWISRRRCDLRPTPEVTSQSHIRVVREKPRPVDRVVLLKEEGRAHGPLPRHFNHPSASYLVRKGNRPESEVGNADLGLRIRSLQGRIRPVHCTQHVPSLLVRNTGLDMRSERRRNRQRFSGATPPEAVPSSCRFGVSPPPAIKAYDAMSAVGLRAGWRSFDWATTMSGDLAHSRVSVASAVSLLTARQWIPSRDYLPNRCANYPSLPEAATGWEARGSRHSGIMISPHVRLLVRSSRPTHSNPRVGSDRDMGDHSCCREPAASSVGAYMDSQY